MVLAAAAVPEARQDKAEEPASLLWWLAPQWSSHKVSWLRALPVAAERETKGSRV